MTSAPKVVKVTSKKTATELAAEKARQRIHAERLKEQAKKSHKDRVTEFNEKLAKLSEHHDIPKVHYLSYMITNIHRRSDQANFSILCIKNNKNNLFKATFPLIQQGHLRSL
jgi:hypothetical protein